MTLAEFTALLETTGLPVTYRAWEEGKAPPLPFICFHSPGADNFAADGRVHFSAHEIVIELYTALYDDKTMAKVEAALSEIYWTRSTEYLGTERCYETIYECEV